MGLKTKIMLILSAAALAAAVVAGGMLIVLLKLIGHTSVAGSELPIAVVFASAIYLLSGLFLLVLLNVLLGKSVVMPAVEREMLENERNMLTEQLHHSQKMEAVGRLAGSIAHDFNNLLTIIDGYASLVIANPGGADAAQNAQEVVGAARRASAITRKLLAFSQKENTELMLLDLNTTLHDAEKMLNRLIGEKVVLVTKPCAEPLHVLADPVQIGQVLMNLAVNARDAMPNGGRITIKIERRQVGDGECGKPCSHSAGTYAEIAVRDTGHGIDDEVAGRIFEPFFTTKKAGKGTGLGLSIVKSIMKQHGGFINVESRLGSGATFFLYLPVAEAPPEPSEKPAPQADAAEPDAASPPGGATILLVEDDPMIRSLVAQTLEQQGYAVLTAEEGWEGIKAARNHKGCIDLLFTDVVMPGLGGAELALATRELYPGIKVLFMSGYARHQLAEEGVPPDADLLEKPFTPDKLVATVRRLLAR